MLVVAHDIGGAQLIFSYLISESIKDYFILAEGPAKYFAESHFSGLKKEVFVSREQAQNLITQQKVTTVITGSSSISELEIEFVRLARSHGIQSICFIDHWTNYKERFLYPKDDWEKNLPDLFWAHDQKSFDLLQTHFPQVEKILKENYFLKIKLNEYKNKKIPFTKNSFLILTEHFSEVFGRSLGYDEFDALDLFFKKLPLLLGNDISYKITIRPHPAEANVANTKYQKYLKYGVSISSEPNVFEDLYRHEYIIGCDTIAMYYASQLERKVFCALPNFGSNCNIPIHDVIYLRDVKNKNERSK